MGYDYSMKNIMRHEQEALKLIEAWKTGETLRVDAGDTDSIMRYQRHVRSLLASIDMNYPSCSGIRKQRTWIHHDKTSRIWTLFIGPGIDKLKGRIPSDPFEDNTGLTKVNLKSDSITRDNDLVEFMQDISDYRQLFTLMDFAFKESGKGTKRIVARSLIRPTEKANASFFAGLAGMGWGIYISSVGTGYQIELRYEGQKEANVESELDRMFNEELRKLQGELP